MPYTERMDRFTRSWVLMKESWAVLRKTPSLMAFPVISALFTILASAAFIVPYWLLVGFKDVEQVRPSVEIPLAFAFYFVTYFIVIFFNSGLVACAHQSLMGGNPTMGDGMHAAIKRMPAILGWTAIAATVGVILKIIGENLGVVGRIVEAVFGIAWSIVTYFVIPIVVIEKGSPVAAIGESAGMFKKTWGERLIGAGGMGLAMLVLFFAPIPFMVLVAFTGMSVLIVPVAILMGLWWIGLMVVGTAMQGIYQTALYVYASTGDTPSGFEQTDFSAAFRSKPQFRDRIGRFGH